MIKFCFAVSVTLAGGFPSPPAGSAPPAPTAGVAPPAPSSLSLASAPPAGLAPPASPPLSPASAPPATPPALAGDKVAGLAGGDARRGVPGCDRGVLKSIVAAATFALDVRRSGKGTGADVASGSGFAFGSRHRKTPNNNHTKHPNPNPPYNPPKPQTVNPTPHVPNPDPKTTHTTHIHPELKAQLVTVSAPNTRTLTS